MKKLLPIAIFFSILFCHKNLSAQNNFWKDVSENKAKSSSYERVIIPNKYRTVSLDAERLLSVLKKAPKEFSQESFSNPLILSIPYPDGTIRRFSVVEYSMMEPELAAKFSSIKTYNGQGIDDKTARIKIDWTEFGFHAMILSDITGSVWIDPFAIGDNKNYISYYKKDLKPKYHTETDVLPPPFESRPLNTLGSQGGPCLGGTLKTYRLAVTNTYEYAQAVKATTAAQLHSAIVTTVNRINAVYESEISVRLILIANNNLIEFLTAADDPFTTAANGSTSTLINESQTQIDRKIGSSNYDIGHAFCTGGGGLAQRGSACVSGAKARGVSGLPNPVGDAFDVDFVAHEIGHQLNASHTFNSTTGSCNGNGTTATNAEPGSGCTIMAYAGQCTATNNLQPNSIPNFHALSFDQISAFINNTSGGASCAASISTGNTAPVVNAGLDYTIPISTPFVLTGSATDANGDALTYSWEQTDFGGTYSNWDAPTGNKAPLFRSFSPSTSPSRTFPRITDVVNNTRTIGEILPSIARPINFRLTVRDNRSGGGGVCYDDVIVTTSGSTAFTVTSQSTATTWTANGSNTATITWDVAGTTASPFNVSAVDILFSVDGGLTYPYTLLSNTPNDGTQSVVIPSATTTRGRVMVKSRGNIFFNINAANITISSTCVAEGAMVSPAATVSAPAGSSSLNLGLAPQYTSVLNISGTLTTSDPVMNLTVNNSNTNPSSCGTYSNEVRYDTYTFTPNITGTYTFNLTAPSNTIMNIYSNNFNVNSPCTNFLKSNSKFVSSFSSGPSLSQTLTVGQVYTLIVTTFNSTVPALPANYSISLFTNPTGGQLYNGTDVYANPGSGFGYNYIVVNNATGNIKSISNSSNLTNTTNYPAGSYTVYGLSFANSITNLNTFVGGSFNTLINSIFSNPSGFCANLSKNSVSVEIGAGSVPVTMLSLKARKNGKQVQLDWGTASEQNSSHFNIQRSADGINFTDVLGKVKAAGNSNTILNYAFADLNPIAGWNYYRLEQVDINGDLSYSNIVAINFDENKIIPLIIYPNPAKDFINVSYSSRISGSMQIQIIDNKGAVVESRRLNVASGNSVNRINTERLSAGVYMLRYITPEGEVSSVKFIKN